MKIDINQKKLITFLLIVLGFVVYISGCSIESTNLIVTPTLMTSKNTITIKETETPLTIKTDDFTGVFHVAPTPSPTVVLLTPTINSMNKIDIPNDYFILTNDLGYELRIVDVGTGVARDLFPEHSLAKFVEWRDNGCQLVVLSEGNLVLVDLNGEQMKTLFSYSALEEKNLVPYGRYFSLSPDGQWVWYWQVDGKGYNEMGPESNYEIQNIFTISKDFSQGPFPITKNGGGWVASWAPTGNQIAFSDYDDNRVVQVFVSSVQGNDKTQVTDFKYQIPFETYGTDILQIDWSPDGKNIAITYISNETQVSGLATEIVDSVNGQINYRQVDARFLWWISESSFMVRDLSDVEDNSIYAQELGANGHGFKLMELEFPNFLQTHPFYSNQYVGFFAEFDDTYFFVFNSQDGSITPISTIRYPDYLIKGWVSPPSTFPGIEFCEKQTIIK